MARFLVILLLASLACRRFTGRWPWQVLAGYMTVVPASGPAKARALLGVRADASREEVIAAHRKLLFEVHPDRGGDATLVHEANAARDLLLARIAKAVGEPPAR